MGFKKIDTWAVPSWSGAYTDRSAGMIGRPERAKDGTKNWQPIVFAKEEKSKGVPGQVVLSTFLDKAKNYTPVANLELSETFVPPAPAPVEERPNFTGVWRLTGTEGQWDQYLKMCDVDPIRRALARGTFYGRNRSLQTIEMPDTNDAIKVENVVDKPFRATVEFVQEGEKVGEPEAKKEGENNGAGANGGGEGGGADAAKADEPLMAEARIAGSSLELKIDGTEQSLGTYMGGGVRCWLYGPPMSAECHHGLPWAVPVARRRFRPPATAGASPC